MALKCPGQDMRFWGPQDVYEVTCGACGYRVEFFKDEPTRICRNCGNRLVNPRLALGCAQWCEHAKECLGFDAKEAQEMVKQQSVVDRLVALLRRELDDECYRRVLGAVDKARRLLRKSTARPGVVLAASMLLAASLPAERLRAVLQEAALPPGILEAVEQVLQGGANSEEARLAAQAAAG